MSDRMYPVAPATLEALEGRVLFSASTPLSTLDVTPAAGPEISARRGSETITDAQASPLYFPAEREGTTASIAQIVITNDGTATLNLGLGGMVVGFFMQPHVGARSAPVTATGGVMFALGGLGFAYNMWRTFNLADARARARAMDKALPTLD